jgi:integrase
MGKSSHLVRRKGRSTYTVRRVVPEHIRSIIGKRELTRSTGETSFRQAERKSWEILAEFDQSIEKAQFDYDRRNRHAELIYDQANNLPRDMFEELTWHLSEDQPFSDPMTDRPGELTSARQEELIREYTQELKAIRRSLARRDLASFVEDIKGWADTQDVKISDEKAKELAPTAAKAHIASLQAAIAALEGEEEPEIQDPDLTPPKPILSSLVPDWLISKRQERLRLTGSSLRASTERDYEGILKVFVALAGDRPVGAYTRRDIVEHQDRLGALPRFHNKDPKLSAFPYPEMIEITRKDPLIERVSGRTIQKHIGAIRLFFDWAIQRELVEVNPCYGMKFERRAKAKEQRKAFTIDQLNILFGAPIYSGCKSSGRRFMRGDTIIFDHRYWLPVLAVWTGARLEELAQLRREDILEADGIKMIRIHEEGDSRRVKNDAASRNIPIHHCLEATGFLEFVEETAKEGRSHIFPELKPAGADQKLSFAFTKWFPRFLRSRGIEGVQFHSLRHSFITAMRDAGIPEDLRMYISGHSRNTSQQDRYAKDPSPKLLKENIDRLSYPGLDMSHLRSAAVGQKKIILKATF